MILNIFKRKKTCKCSFCQKEVDTEAIFTLQYKSAEGIGTMNLCLECATYMNDIIENFESVMNEKNTI